ncbi:curli-like amyloid fiber formation chaperone CsgH [Parvibaculum sp.]|uniref:curli-like amyloid fiber formation chaperone CsgH n=1 Tax=Parvibaculum sp. TaxID=2024848 RepID=UPI0025DD9A48|nr:curli-like amyloid fiber formation chaperone CsgH [Parvibaculum sp.]
MVYGAPGEAGSYSMSLERAGSGGTSEVRQAGDFVIEDGGEAVISVTEFNRDARARLHAHMTVENGYGTYSCGF